MMINTWTLHVFVWVLGVKRNADILREAYPDDVLIAEGVNLEAIDRIAKRVDEAVSTDWHVAYVVRCAVQGAEKVDVPFGTEHDRDVEIFRLVAGVDRPKLSYGEAANKLGDSRGAVIQAYRRIKAKADMIRELVRETAEHIRQIEQIALQHFPETCSEK